MQVASRLLLVWPVVHKLGNGLFVTGSAALLRRGVDAGLGGVPGLDVLARWGARMGNLFGGMGGSLSEVQQNQAAYVGMVLAWSVAECIRYLYFIYYAGSASGKAPKWLMWLRWVRVSVRVMIYGVLADLIGITPFSCFTPSVLAANASSSTAPSPSQHTWTNATPLR